MRVGRTTEALPIGPTSAIAVGTPAPSTDVDATEPARHGEHATIEARPHPFVELLRGIGQELDRGESIAEKAIRGGGGHTAWSPERLIALQAGIYRYSEAVDLVTKLVDRGTQAVRTTLQNQ